MKMDRRDTLRTLLIGSIAGAGIVTVGGCKTDGIVPDLEDKAADGLYGRTPNEIEYDNEVQASVYLNEDELACIATLCDIILPPTSTAVSATAAGVPEFIEFIVKDLPSHQLPIRGGIMWLDIQANTRFSKEFIACSKSQQIEIIDDIAYPDPNNEKPDMAVGRKFFDRMRNLTLTGYYTSQEGIKDLGYVGNAPNVWDGVPDEVLKKHGVEYDPEWIAKCVDQSKRGEIAVWDDDMNLIS